MPHRHGAKMKICYLEDEHTQIELFKSYLYRFQQEHTDFQYTLECYNSAVKFLETYQRDTDLLFLDIQVPDMLGIDVARRIREVDQNVMIIFLTNLTQYAIDGYSVNAFDYILKPLNYFSFSRKLQRALRMLSYRSSKQTLDVKTKEGGMRLAVDTIIYIEVSAHDIYIHTITEQIKQWGTLSKYEKLLKNEHFIRCGSSFLVNLKYVREIRRDQVLMANSDSVPISRTRRKEFLGALAQYKGGSL